MMPTICAIGVIFGLIGLAMPPYGITVINCVLVVGVVVNAIGFGAALSSQDRPRSEKETP